MAIWWSSLCPQRLLQTACKQLQQASTLLVWSNCSGRSRVSCDSCILCLPLALFRTADSDSRSIEESRLKYVLCYLLVLNQFCTSCVSMLDDTHGVAVVGHAQGEMHIYCQLKCFTWLAKRLTSHAHNWNVQRTTLSVVARQTMLDIPN